MNKSRNLYLMLSVLSILLAGCASKTKFAASEPICIRNADRAAVMETAAAVLTKMHFVIEKNDLDSGFILTRPLRAGQLPEVWRRDNVGPASISEANLHSIQRIVRLNVFQDFSSTTGKNFFNRASLGDRFGNHTS